ACSTISATATGMLGWRDRDQGPFSATSSQVLECDGLIGASDDFDGELVQSLDAAAQPVSPHPRAHAGWRAGEDKIARLQQVVAGKERDRLGHAPDQLRQVPLLPDPAAG